MKIDIEKAIKEFIKYTENYDLTDFHLEGKQEHSLRVMEISKQIAERLNLSEIEVQVATIIGLLHDVARFEQWKKYKTFKDLESIDHGDLAVEILKTDLRKYVEITDYDEIILKAIKNHNKFQIIDELNEKERLFAEIIRDADKIDIFYESLEIFWIGREEEIANSNMSDKIFETIINKQLLKRQKGEKRQPIESIVSVMAFVFDINQKPSFEIIKENDYINKILNKYIVKDIDTKEKVEKIRTVVNTFIDEKIQEK